MTPMHPHWQSTEDEQQVPVRVKDAGQPAVAAPRATRASAAVVGILLMAGVVVYTFGGIEAMLGQLTNPTPDVTIRLTQDGAVPPVATVRAGQVIRWLNEDQIPHVLSSETLPTEDGSPFVSTAIFSNTDYFYTVPLTAENATHAYISETSPDLAGEIVIGDGAVPAATGSTATSSSSSAPVLSAPTSSAAELPIPSSSAVPLPLPTQSSSSSSVAAQPLPANVIAVNPYTVGKKPGSSAKPVTQHKPTKNAESGPAVWIAFAVSAAAIVIVTRRAFRRV